MTLRDHIKNAGYALVDEKHYKQIDAWKAWYQGKVHDFHNYNVYNGGTPIRRKRASINMAKQGCEYWANLLWTHDCAVNLGATNKSGDDELVNEVLKQNDFTRQTCVLIERAWALGSGAFVAFKEQDNTRIDYVTAEYIFPLSWRNDDIESCAFGAAYNQGNKRLIYLMIHEKQTNGDYVITNRFFERKKDSDDLTPTEIPSELNIKESYTVSTKRFAIIQPNIANNATDAPLGMSVYANCIDTLKSIDLAYDGAKSAMEVGRPRIGVTSNMLKIDETTGAPVFGFDANDTAVYDLGQGGADSKTLIQDMTTPYRALEYEQSLQTQLTVYAQCIGLGDNTFKWNRAAGDVSKTATEVVSNNSVMLRTMEKHQDGLRSAITELVRAILDINGRDAWQDVNVIFDDSVTRDKAQEAQEAWMWVVAGKYPFWRFLVDFKGFDEQEARARASEAQQDMPTPIEE